MLRKHEVLAQLRQTGVVAVLRAENPADLVAVAKALNAGGVNFIEITMTTPGAIGVIQEATAELKGQNVFIGAGTVLDAPTARAAILAGATFVVGPAFDLETVRLCNSYGVAVMPGALTPTEVFQAWKAGADVVKIFPGDIGGPDYLKTLKEPLPQVELMPTKGVDFNTASAYLKAGAIAVGTGSTLVSKTLIAARDFTRITANAERFTQIVREVKGEQQR